MSEKTSQDNLLAKNSGPEPNLDVMRAEDLKKAVAFWFDTKTANKLRKGELGPALRAVFHDRERLKAGLAKLSEQEMQVLAICRSYGGAVSGSLLYAEMLSRGLEEATEAPRNQFVTRHHPGPVERLCAKLLLVPRDAYGHYRYSAYEYSYSFFGYGSRSKHPDVMMPSALVRLIEPVAVIPWAMTKTVASPPTRYRRSTTAAILEIGTIAQSLAQMGSWKTNRGGSLPKSMQNRLEKLLPAEPNDELRPPDVASLCYEILRGEGVVHVDGDQAHIDTVRLHHFLGRPPLRQSRAIVRSWIQSQLWQDGIGVVPDRDSPRDPVRITPEALIEARELLVWALGRLARAPAAWLDLETFLTDWYTARGELSGSGFWFSYAWWPDFKGARNKESIPAGPKRSRAYWLTAEGVWAANALMSTLAYLGLIERSAVLNDLAAFCLTETGRAVFGGAEQAEHAAPQDAKFLAVQPNHDVLVYLEEADPSKIFTLARMARRTSTGNDPVQTFVLSRESVYQGLESGLTTEQMREFLLQASKTGLPNNVAHSLNEWGRKRDSLVLRSGLTLLAVPPTSVNRLPTIEKGRRLGDQFLLVPPAERHSFKGQKRDHALFTPAGWTVGEDGLVRAEADADSATLARLEQLTEPTEQGRKITAVSIRRARDQGIAAEQALGWLRLHSVGAFPSIIEMAIRNWFSAGRVNLGPLLLLQVPQAQACQAILASKRFRACFLSHVPPNWFIVSADQKKELSNLLREFGFVLDQEFQMEPLPNPLSADEIASPARPKARASKKSRSKR